MCLFGCMNLKNNKHGISKVVLDCTARCGHGVNEACSSRIHHEAVI